MAQVTTRTIMLHVDLRYNERGDLLQGYGQVTWPEHISMVPPTCHVTRMINKKDFKRKQQEKKHVTTTSVERCCIPLQLQGLNLE